MFSLLEELKKYKPFDEREKEDLNKTLHFLENNSNCYDRSNKIGHITAGAFICDKSGNILLNHHKKIWYVVSIWWT